MIDKEIEGDVRRRCEIDRLREIGRGKIRSRIVFPFLYRPTRRIARCGKLPAVVGFEIEIDRVGGRGGFGRFGLRGRERHLKVIDIGSRFRRAEKDERLLFFIQFA